MNRTIRIRSTLVALGAAVLFASLLFAAVAPALRAEPRSTARSASASTIRVAFVAPLPTGERASRGSGRRRARDRDGGDDASGAAAAAETLADPRVAAFAELLAGVRSAAKASPFDREGDAPPAKIEVVTIDASDLSGRALASAIRRAKAHAIVGAPNAGSTDDLVTAARSLRLPLVLVTPWEPRFSIDARDPITHLAPSLVDHAIAAGNYAMIPLGAKRMAVVHDGTAPSRDLADAFARNRPIPVGDGGVHALGASPEDAATLLATLRSEGVDTLFVATGPQGAARIAEAARALEAGAASASGDDAGTSGSSGRRRSSSSTAGQGRREVPELLFADGNASAALVAAAPASARFLEAVSPWFEAEHREACREALGDDATPQHERGYAAMRLLDAAFALGGHPKRIAESMRRVANPHAAGSSVLTPWGAPRELVTHLVARPGEGVSAAAGDGGPVVRINPLTLPDVGGGTLLRYRETSYYAMEEDSRRVLLTFGAEDERTIESDLKALGLSSGGYEAEVDSWVRDAILARAIAYLHKVFGRNADGTPIPGVSYDVTFATELPPGVEPREVWTMTIAGDDPSAWGRAFPPNRAYAYASKLAHQLYAQYALDPPLGTDDNRYFRYRYRWNTSLQENLRHDSIRALIDGFASAVAMTTAHELGHLAGCSHDRESPRSIMNVVDGGGISPLWAEWIPSHVEKLERALDRVEPERP